MTSVGIRLGKLVAGRPDVWGFSRYVFRRGEGWFEEFRDGGLGWNFERHAKSAMDRRVDLLLDMLGLGSQHWII